MNDFMELAALVILVITVIVHIAFSIGVREDAIKQQSQGALRYVTPIVWCLATLLGGVFVAAAYWIMHGSTLVPERVTSSEQESFNRSSSTA